MSDVRLPTLPSPGQKHTISTQRLNTHQYSQSPRADFSKSSRSLVKTLRQDPVFIEQNKPDGTNKRLYGYATQSAFSKYKNTRFLSPSKASPKISQNKVVTDILRNSNVLMKNDTIVQNLDKMNRMKLLNQYSTNIQEFKRNQRVQYVYNDYHSKSTNNGYSRNIIGGYFFTR